MLISKLHSAVIIALAMQTHPYLLFGQAPAVPGPELTINRGETFSVELQLLDSVPQALEASAEYIGPPSPNKQVPRTREEMMRQGMFNDRGFQCSGTVLPNAKTFLLSCQTWPGLVQGVYKSPGDVVLRGGSESKRVSGIRFPIVTIVYPPPPDPPPPPPPTQFPEIVSAALAPTPSQTLRDGSVRAEAILKETEKQFPNSVKNTRQNRSYLLQKVAQTRILVNSTKARYETKPQLDHSPKLTTPIFFEDLDRRLQRISSQLSVSLSGSAYLEEEGKPRFVLVQMPKRSDSATATAESDTKIEKALEDFVEVLEDATKGFEKISKTGITVFKWSLSTQPTGASLYISRLDEPETHWSGISDFKDQTLEYARWRFRIDWNGCSKMETPDPYLQSEINIYSFKLGCKPQ